MARSRKTIAVSEVVQRLNTMLANTDGNALHGSQTMNAHDWQMMRKGMALMMEDILHLTGNYRGYQYTTDYKIDDSARQYTMPRE